MEKKVVYVKKKFKNMYLSTAKELKIKAILINVSFLCRNR